MRQASNSQPDGKCSSTSDGGTNWASRPTGTSQAMNRIFFTDALTGWSVGDNGTILHTTNGGLTFVDGERPDEVPKEILLSQNYPNPFNPVTNFQFSIANSQLTILKVYDVLGREVATLVSEVKQLGTYSVRFDGSGLVSGIYFYRLDAGSFTSAKKMLLLK
jgi:hypothetical protein